MTVQELRIGNLVDYEKTTHIISSINEDGSLISYWKGDDNPYHHTIDSIEGIKLSPEILEKAGFKKDIELQDFNGLYNYYQNGKVQGNFYKNGEFKPEWGKFKTINYLHQLQNLYHSLTGTELIIKL